MINCSADGRSLLFAILPRYLALQQPVSSFFYSSPSTFLNQQYAAANGKNKTINKSRDKPDLL
jgi:hypothetical protein